MCPRRVNASNTPERRLRRWRRCVLEIRRHGERPLAGCRHVSRLSVAEEATPPQRGEGGLEVVGRHVLQRPVGHQVAEEQLVARRLEQDVHQERQTLPEGPEAL